MIIEEIYLLERETMPEKVFVAKMAERQDNHAQRCTASMLCNSTGTLRMGSLMHGENWAQ